MADWDTTNPDDGDIVSQYPANERAARAAVVTNFGVDHHEVDDADIGKHEVIQLTAEATPTIAAGDVGLWNDSGVLKTRSGASSVQTVGYQGELNAPAGTKIVFYQASAPTGWTQDVAVNDQVLKVVSGTGGGTGGSWTISGVTVDNHALTIPELPVHNHTGSTENAGAHNHGGTTGNNGGHNHNSAVAAASSNIVTGGGTMRAGRGSTATGFEGNLDIQDFSTGSVASHDHTISSVSDHSHSIPSAGSGNAHNHGLTADGTWRPSHIDVIVAEKD